MDNIIEWSDSWIAEENRKIAAIRREEMRRTNEIDGGALPGVQVEQVQEDTNKLQAKNMTDCVGPERSPYFFS